MDLSLGNPSSGSGGSLGNPSTGTGGSSMERDSQASFKRERPYYNHHTTEQTDRLERLFIENPHPDEAERRSIAKELMLEPKQVKFWFQNKRTQKKAQKQREENNALRAENERMEKENVALREEMKSFFCKSCGGSPSADNSQDRGHSRQQLQLENALLKDEYMKAAKLLESCLNKNHTPQPELELDLILSLVHGPFVAMAPNSAAENVPQNLGLASTSHSIPDKIVMPKPLSKLDEMIENALMLRVALAAKEELVKLLCTNAPLWVQSEFDHRKLVLHPESYEKLFPKVNHFESNSQVREESTKDSRIVGIKAMKIIEMLMDSSKWSNLFSTMISSANTIKVIENGSSEDRSGALLLMHGEMHILSPVVPSREFYFLRYCEKVEDHAWVITDVSFDYLKEKTPSRSWRLPSGCMIKEMPYECSLVTWVEHVEVEEKIPVHPLYKHVVCTTIAFGAQRWLIELQRMCERFSSVAPRGVNVEPVPDGRRRIIKLSHRMIKRFFDILIMSDDPDFPPIAPPHGFTEENKSQIRISVRKNTNPNDPNGVIFVAAASLWLPTTPQNLFNFFTDVENRVKWDALSSPTNPMIELTSVQTGTHPGNCLSLMRPAIPCGMMVLQETFIDPLGSHVIYAPVPVPDLVLTVVHGQDSSHIFLLPSGITISEDGTNARASSSSGTGNGGRTVGGSLLTIAFQIPMSAPATMNVDTLASVNSLMTETVNRVKEALNVE